MQVDNYLTLNRTIPEYFRLIRDGKDKSKIQSERLLMLHLARWTDTLPKMSPTAFVAMCDPRSKLAIFEHLWKDRTHTDTLPRDLLKIQKSSHEITCYWDIEPHEDSPGTEDEEDDLFAGYHGHSDPAVAESDSWLSHNWLSHKWQEIIWVYLQPQLPLSVSFRMEEI